MHESYRERRHEPDSRDRRPTRDRYRSRDHKDQYNPYQVHTFCFIEFKWRPLMLQCCRVLHMIRTIRTINNISTTRILGERIRRHTPNGTASTTSRPLGVPPLLLAKIEHLCTPGGVPPMRTWEKTGKYLHFLPQFSFSCFIHDVLCYV